VLFGYQAEDGEHENERKHEESHHYMRGVQANQGVVSGSEEEDVPAVVES
jgi:hypothetical protein